MNITLLFARTRSISLETGYGVEQARRLLHSQTTVVAERDFSKTDTAADVLAEVDTDLVLVLTDPTAIASPNMVSTLSKLLETNPEAAAAIPRTNVTSNAAQRGEVPQSFLTLGQFERRFFETGQRARLIEGADADPGLFLVRREAIAAVDAPLPRALGGLTVLLAEEAFLFRYAPQQRMPRTDLLELIPNDVESILEIGCGEGILGEQIRNRQGARVVGVEIDPTAAERARNRLDEVHAKDVRDAIRELDERFEWVVGGDVLEHLTDPWEFLRELKRVTRPGGRLLLSIPNVAAWPVVAELLRGRFDYMYAGHLSSGHLRFFTRRTIEDTIAMAAWKLEWIRPMPEFAPEEREELFAKLDRGGIAYSREDLSVSGWYVLARNDE